MSCTPGLHEELEEALSRGVTTILALGNTATRALGIQGSMQTVRGSVYEWVAHSGKKAYVIPTYHQSGILRRNWTRSNGGKADEAVLWLADFRKARTLSEEGWHPLKENFQLEPSLSDVGKFVEKAIQTNALVAVDTETTGLSTAYARIVVIGLALDAENALSVPLLTTGGKSYWTPDELPIIHNLMQKLFSSCDQLYQNSFFDVPMLEAWGLVIPDNRVAQDTLLMAHTLAPEARHDLGTIVSLYGKTPYWKEEFKNRTVTILQMDQLSMRRYNLRDCVVLHQVYPVMVKEMQNLGVYKFYNDEVKPLMNPIRELNRTGVGFSSQREANLKLDLGNRIATLKTKLLQAYGLPESLNLDSDDHIRWFLYGIEPTSFKHLPELEKKKPGTKIYLELSALKQLHDEGGPRFLLPSWTPPKTDSGLKASVDAEALLSYRIQLNNYRTQKLSKKTLTPEDTDAIGNVDKMLGWLKDFSEYNRFQKILTTYTNYAPRPDGRIYAQWLQSGTVTGRISCKSPNLMNLVSSKEDPQDPANKVRALFVARPGWSFVSADYVNLEAQILAFETEDPILIKVFAEGLNLHDLNTRSMFHLEPTDPIWKPARRASKVFFFGGISYGGGDMTVYREVYLTAPELNLSFADFKKAKANWLSDHPAYTLWKNRIIEEVHSRRQITTEFGRVRQFLGNDRDIEKEALDTKIQSAGASLVNRAMIRIYEERNRLGLKARFVLQVHDELIMECPDTEIDQVKTLMKQELEKPFTYKGTQRSIPVDVSVGKDIGALG